jgi:hypothetical protein
MRTGAGWQDTRVKTAMRAALAATGLDYLTFSAFWTFHGPRKNLLTPWNTRHRVLFIHIPKNAGTAVDAMLQMERCPDYHAPACAYLAADPAFFNGAYKFCVIRNPWDRLVSAFHYMLSSPLKTDMRWREAHLAGLTSFPEFAERLTHPAFRAAAFSNFVFRPQWHFIADWRGRIIIDNLIRFETLDRELAAVAARLGVELSNRRLNASAHAPYQSYYDARSKDIVTRLYRRDIKLLGYRFDEDAPAFGPPTAGLRSQAQRGSNSA